MKSLKETLTQQTEESVRALMEKTEREAAAKAKIAEGFDEAAGAAGYGGPLPHMTIAHALYGSVGSLNWNEMSFDDALRIMRAFPAVPAGIYRDGSFTSFRPAASLVFPLKDGHRFDQSSEPYAMRISGGLGYGQKVAIEWTADLAGVSVRFSIELKGPHDVLPRISFEANQWQGTAVSIKRETERVVVPLGGTIPLVARYSAGSDTALRDCLFVGPEVVRYIERAVEYLDARDRETREAYEHAKDASPVVLPLRAEVDALAETLREHYDREKLRAGTLRQFAALQMPAALVDRDVAEKHWPRYAEEHGIDRGRYGFDHYSWACGWLARLDLLTDEYNGGPYKYGSAWLEPQNQQVTAPGP